MPKPSLMDTTHYAHILISIARGIETPGEIRCYIKDQTGIRMGIYDKLAKMESYGLISQGKRIFGKSKGNKVGGSIGCYTINPDEIYTFIKDNFLGSWNTPNSLILDIEASSKIKRTIISPLIELIPLIDNLRRERIKKIEAKFKEKRSGEKIHLDNRNDSTIEKAMDIISSKTKDRIDRKFLTSNKRELLIFFRKVLEESQFYNKDFEKCYKNQVKKIIKKKHRIIEISNEERKIGNAFIRFLVSLSGRESIYHSITIRKIIDGFICSSAELYIWGMPDLPDNRFKTPVSDEILSFGRSAFNYWYAKDSSQLKMDLIDSIIPQGTPPKRVTKLKSNIEQFMKYNNLE